MELYLFKSAACLAILFLFYKLLLEKEAIHTFKRFYLIGALLLSFGIPILTFTSYIESSGTVSQVFSSEAMASEIIESTNYLPYFLWTLYALGVLFFSLKFFRNLRNLIQKIKNNPKLKMHHITNVLLSDPVAPHTFFSYIFLNKQKFEAREIPSEVIIHEEAHALQRHSLDVLFIELLQIVFWFNPLIHLTRQSIKLNHEFLADRAVIENGVETVAYQKLLLAFSSNAETPQLAHSINYSSIKKRLTVMKTRTSKQSILLRSLILLPLLATLIFGFSSREIVPVVQPLNVSILNQEQASQDQVDAYNKMAAFWNNYFIETYPERIMPLSELHKLETIYRTMTAQQRAAAEPFPECNPTTNETLDKATPEQIAEYNKLAKHYNSMTHDNMFVKKKDVERLKYLYNLMSPEQRKNAEPFPNFPPPPPKAPKVPKTPKAPKAPKVVKGSNGADANIPPPPPIVSVDPVDHMIRMANENAAFFYENKPISSKEAIEMVRNDASLYVDTTIFEKSNPIVKISKQAIEKEK